MGRDFNSESGREASRRSAAARKRLTLSEVEEQLGGLDSVEDAQRRLERLGVWLTAGLVSGSQGGSAVRATETWLKAHSEKLDRDRLRQTEQRVKELERELDTVRRRGLNLA